MKNKDLRDELTDPPKEKVTNADGSGVVGIPKPSDTGKSTESENVSIEDVIPEKAILNSEINPTDTPLK